MDGGGAYYYDSNIVSMENSSISLLGNVAPNTGGALVSITSHITLMHNSKMSIFNNTAENSGGGLALFYNI